MENKKHLGDGVYVQQSGVDLILTTENGIEWTNRIVIEPAVLNELIEYLSLERKKVYRHETQK